MFISLFRLTFPFSVWRREPINCRFQGGFVYLCTDKTTRKTTISLQQHRQHNSPRVLRVWISATHIQWKHFLVIKYDIHFEQRSKLGKCGGDCIVFRWEENESFVSNKDHVKRILRPEAYVTTTTDVSWLLRTLFFSRHKSVIYWFQMAMKCKFVL